MNVWIVNHYAIPPSMGGLVRHYYFSKYLQKKGHSVKIFTSSKIHNTDINMIRDKSLYREEMEDGVHLLPIYLLHYLHYYLVESTKYQLLWKYEIYGRSRL